MKTPATIPSVTEKHHAQSAVVPSLTLSTVHFYCDLSRRNGRVIPLGVMAEILLPQMRGLGLIGRTELHTTELAAVGDIGRRLVERPFAFLSQEFDDAWENAVPGEALLWLSGKHRQSLHFAIPRNIALPLTLNIGESTPTARNAVRNFLGQLLEEEMVRLTLGYELLAPKPSPQQELLSLKSVA
jgi:hypothetical protein